MNDKLYTQCPSCETTFALTPAQLEAREGLVRCGFCSAVFRADQYLRPPPGSREGRARNGDLATAPGPHRREPEQNQGRETAPESIADISLERDSTPQ
ncbi:MAG: MJ0042-type zinc finger domain-containing protein, partial [Lysobacteraceae bacterium]